MNFTQGTTTGNPFWDKVRDFLSTPTEEEIACQEPKPILFNTGDMLKPYAWEPSTLPIQVSLSPSLSPAFLTRSPALPHRQCVHRHPSLRVHHYGRQKIAQVPPRVHRLLWHGPRRPGDLHHHRWPLQLILALCDHIRGVPGPEIRGGFHLIRYLSPLPPSPLWSLTRPQVPTHLSDSNKSLLVSLQTWLLAHPPPPPLPLKI
jgi:hypothetical protein